MFLSKLLKNALYVFKLDGITDRWAIQFLYAPVCPLCTFQDGE